MPELATQEDTQQSVKLIKSRIDEATLLICNAIKESEDNLKNTLHKEFDKWDMDYRDRKPPKIYPFRGCANFSVNVTSTNIDGMTPRLVEDLFDYEEPIQAFAVDVQDEDKKLASVINRFLSWDIESHDDLREEYWFCIENAEIKGLSFAYTYHESEKETISTDYMTLVIDGKPGIGKYGKPIPYTSETVQSLQEKGISVEEKQVTIKEFKYKKYGPKTICVDAKDVAWNKDAISIDDAFNNGFVSLKIFKTLDEIKRIVQADNDSIFSNWKKFKEVLERQRDQSYTQAWRPKKLELRLVWTRLDIDNDDLEEKVVMLIEPETNTLIGMQEFPYDHGECPIVPFRIKPIHKKIAGIGIAEMLWNEKGYLDSMRNQMADNRTLHNSPVTLYTKTSEFNPAIHKHGFNAQWRLNDISESSIRFQNVAPIHNDTWNEFSTLKSECNQRVGMSEITKGAMPDQSITFRGMMMLLEEGSKSRGMFKRWMAQSIQKVTYQRFRLYQQYWGKKAREDVQIQEWITSILGVNSKIFVDAGKMEVLDHKFNIVLKATNDDKKINAVRTRDTAEFLLQQPEVQQYPEIKRKIIIEQLTSNGVKDPESYFPTKDQMEEMEQLRVTTAQRQIAEEQAQKKADDDQRLQEALKQKDLEEVEEIGKKETEREIGRLEEREKLGLLGNIESTEEVQNKTMNAIEKEL